MILNGYHSFYLSEKMNCPACIASPKLFLASATHRLTAFPKDLTPVYKDDFLGFLFLPF
jgi:hypothetical protein